MTLTSSWETRPLADVVDVLDARRIPVKASDRAARGGGVPYYGATGQAGTIDQAIFDEPLVLLGEDGAPFLDPYKSKAYLIDGPAWVNNHAHVLRPRDGLDRKFLRYYLDAFDYRGYANGTTRLKLTQAAMRAMPVPVPHPQEQRQIVEILEDHLSRLDAADRLLRDQVRRLRSLRSATIHSALAVPCRSEVPLRELLSTSIGGLWGNEAGVDEVDVRVLRVTELKRHGRLDPSTAARRSIATRQLESRALQAGDLLLEKSGGGPTQPVGRVGLVPKLDEVSICANFMQLMRPDGSRVDSRYLHLFLNDFHERGGTVPLQKASTNIRNVKASEYLLLPVPLPSLERQRQVVCDLELFLDQFAHLERSVLQGVARGQRLRRSLLAAAFSGELTERRPEDEVKELAQ